MNNTEVTDTLARGRAWRQVIMLDTVTVVRPGAKTYNATSQTYAEAPPTAVYTGPCRVKPWRGNEEQAAEAEIAVYRYQLQFPLTATAPEIKRSDTVTVTASSHPAMVGKVLTVTEPELGTTATALTAIAELAS